MAGELNIGSVVGYLRLNASQWSAEIDTVKGQARELSRVNPKIDIETNAPKALAELEAVAIAAKRLQDAQGKASVAQSRLNDLEEKGITSGTRYTKAQSDLARASRDVELSQIRVAKAFEGSADGIDKLGQKTAESLPNLWSVAVLGPAIGAALTLVGPLASVGAAALGVMALGAGGVAKEFQNGLTPAIKDLQQVAGDALLPGATETVNELQQALPKLAPLVSIFGAAIGTEAAKLATYLENGGIEKFTQYAEHELPIVQQALESLTVAGVKFFSAVTPLGNGLIAQLTLIANLISTIVDGYEKINSLTGGKLGSAGAAAANPFVNTPKDAYKQVQALTTTTVTGQGTQAGAAANLDQVGQSAYRMAADMQDAAANTMAAKNQVAELARVAPNANTAMQGLLTSMATYAGSTGTAVDKAALLGAVLKASQGDALSYAGAISQGYDAFHSLTITFQEQTKDTQKGVLAFRDTEKAAIDLKTGLIDLKATGAAPLVQQLQAMQDAATKAAEATYQHEVATKGQSTALTDAQTIFESMTGGTLVENAAQLGLTKDQAKKLADQYFAMPSDVTTTVQSVGLNDINSTLDQIGQQLSILTGKPWVVDLQLSAASLKNLGGLHDVVNNIPGHAGGGSVDDGWFTAGEAGWELGYKSGSNVQFYSNSQSKAMAPASSPASGTLESTTYLMLDRKVIAQSTNEQNLANARRS